jgi:hypothetical protein
VLYATGLREEASLADLLDASGFRPNRLLVRSADGTIVAASAPAIWWPNPVKPLPPSSGTEALALKGPGTIYVVAANSDSMGHNLEDDRLALVVLRGATLSMTAGPSNCALATAERASPDHRCLLASGGQRFLWVEGRLHNKSGGTFAIHVMNTRYLQLRRVHADSFTQFAISLQTATTCRLHDVVANHNGKYGIVVATATSQNVLTRITASGNGTAANPGHTGVFVTNAGDTVITRMVAAHNEPYGLLLYNGALRTTIGFATLVGNSYANGSLGGNGGHAFFSSVSLRAGTASGVTVSSKNNQLASLALGHQPIGLHLSSGASATVSQDLVLAGNGTDCKLDAGPVSCASLPGGPKPSTSTGLGAALAGRVTVEDVANLSDQKGSGLHGQIEDWISFDHPSRGWGPEAADFTVPAAAGRCTASCRIWDWRLGASPGALAPSGGAVQAALSCPAAADGNRALTDASGNTFLLNALERIGDGLGDDDGLCESGEGCVFAPHLGAAQAGVHPGSGPCVFADGKVSGVRLYGLID